MGTALSHPPQRATEQWNHRLGPQLALFAHFKARRERHSLPAQGLGDCLALLMAAGQMCREESPRATNKGLQNCGRPPSPPTSTRMVASKSAMLLPAQIPGVSSRVAHWVYAGKSLQRKQRAGTGPRHLSKAFRCSDALPLSKGTQMWTAREEPHAAAAWAVSLPPDEDVAQPAPEAV